MQQLDQRFLELTQAVENLRNSRKADKAYFGLHCRLRFEDQQLQVGDLVLLTAPPAIRAVAIVSPSWTTGGQGLTGFGRSPRTRRFIGWRN